MNIRRSFDAESFFWNELEESPTGDMCESSEDGCASRLRDAQAVPGRREAQFQAAPAVTAEKPAGSVPVPWAGLSFRQWLGARQTPGGGVAGESAGGEVHQVEAEAAMTARSF